MAHVTPGMSEIRDAVVSYFRTNNKNLHIPAKQLRSPSLQRILTVLKPGTMPSFLHLYEGGGVTMVAVKAIVLNGLGYINQAKSIFL